MALEGEISRLKSFAQQMADKRRVEAAAHFRLAADALETGPIENFSLRVDEAHTSFEHSLQIGTLISLLDTHHEQIIQAFSSAGLEIPVDEAEIRAQKEKERTEDLAKIRTNLGDPEKFTGHTTPYAKTQPAKFQGLNFPKDISQNPFDEIKVSLKLTRALQDADIHDANDLLEQETEKLAKIKGIGKKGVDEIVTALYNAGVRVKEEEPQQPITATIPSREKGNTLNSLDRKKFTEPAGRTLNLAEEEALRLNHNYLGTEHILLGLLREPETIAGKALNSLGIDLNKTRLAVEMIIGRGDRTVLQETLLTPRTKKVIELALDEAGKQGRDTITSQDLLLGLVREGEGIAAGALESLGVNLQRVRMAIVTASTQQA
jgi:hypothetical protein